jgi:hypothetical protein
MNCRLLTMNINHDAHQLLNACKGTAVARIQDRHFVSSPSREDLRYGAPRTYVDREEMFIVVLHCLRFTRFECLGKAFG